MTQIKVVTDDNKSFTINLEILTCSKVIMEMFEFVGVGGIEDELVPIPHIQGDILEKIFEWATHHKDDPVVEPVAKNARKINTGLSKWDSEFMEANRESVKEIFLAADYLGIDPLIETCAKYVAKNIRGKSAEKIRQFFNFKPKQYREEDAMEVEEEKEERMSKRRKLQ